MKRAAFVTFLRELADLVEAGDSLEGRVRYMLADEPDDVLVDLMVREGNLEGQGSWTTLDEIKDRIFRPDDYPDEGAT